MGQKDIREKLLEDYNDVFADIYNVLVFGEDIIIPEQLKEGPTESVYKAIDGDYREQRRDVLKSYQDICQLEIAFFGIENQTKVDRYIPVRTMGYDYTKYRSQADKDTFPLIPVITIVLNFSDIQWGKCTSLLGIMDVPTELIPFIQDYQVKVFDIAFLEDETIERFKSDFRLIARFFKNRRLGKDPLGEEKEIEHLTEVIDFLTVFTGDLKYSDTKERLTELKKRGVKVTMCRVAQELWGKGEAVGLAAGENKMAKLVNYLLSKGMIEEAKRATSDEMARKEMYKKYKIED